MTTKPLSQKESGAYYTPDQVAQTLLHWAIRAESDRLLDPSCGDGQFIARHRNAVGVEQDEQAASRAVERAPGASVHRGDFFAWAESTAERFDCASGNPPFIRYQTFKGEVRNRAQAICKRLGATFTGLSSSWAPFLVATAGLLRPGGRMAFVVPAEIGHAPYAVPLLEYLVRNFHTVHVVAVRDKLFPDLSEDCWLLFADGFGAATAEIRFSALTMFKHMRMPPSQFQRIPINEWRGEWGGRLRPFLMSGPARTLYRRVATDRQTRRFGELASIGIGYVTGANDFFHLRPSEARHWNIPDQLLHTTVRKGSSLPRRRLTRSTVNEWRRLDEQVLLLRIPKGVSVPVSVRRYLDTESGHQARQAYKCQVRDPWYSVPDVQVPDFFLSYMSGKEASLVLNEADCTCTNSLHSVRLQEHVAAGDLAETWETEFVKLSCELEGHPLGGGMLKLEPREATRIVLPSIEIRAALEQNIVSEALATMREWRHHVASA